MFTIETRNMAYQVFNAVEGASCDFAEQLLVLGVDRVVGRALCMEWAAEKYKVRLSMGQRGLMLPRNSAAEQAFYRVVAFVWPAVSATPKKAKRSKVDPIEALIKKINALTPAQRRRIRAAI
jgi:hypothetical protein